MNKKYLSALMSTVLLGAGLTSVAANAAPTNGNLSFTFSGTIPALPVEGGAWKFVQADGTTAYVPPSSIAFSAADTASGVQLTSTSESFYIKPNTGTFTSSSRITAMLTSNPTIAGTAIKASESSTVTTAITINGTAIRVGTVTDIATPTGSAAFLLTLGAVVDIPTAARNAAGGNITVTAPIRFAADITAP
ncbi:hypothetical protein VSVS12_02808 [Vibrio scophthalmi]|nr:hypothetical protein VSVS12_02808 [Vibrio scophthalmi]